MRVSIFILVIIFLFSCKHEKPAVVDYTGFIQKETVLVGLDKNDQEKDTLGTLSIMLPSRLDTFYKWQHYSDCKTCGETKYRFADNHYDQYAENGFFWSVVPDSIYQLSIWHKPYREVPDSIIYPYVQAEDSSVYFNRLPSKLSDMPNVSYLKREYKQINNRNFIIVGFSTESGYLTQKKTEYLVAVTNLKSRLIYFIAECSSKNSEGFAEQLYKSFQSIRIFEK